MLSLVQKQFLLGLMCIFGQEIISCSKNKFNASKEVIYY